MLGKDTNIYKWNDLTKSTHRVIKRIKNSIFTNGNVGRFTNGLFCHLFFNLLPWSFGSWIYNYQCNQFLSPPMLWGVQHYVVMFVTGLWFSPGPSVSSTNKTCRHDIAEIFFKVAFNTIKQTYAHIIQSFNKITISRILGNPVKGR